MFRLLLLFLSLLVTNGEYHCPETWNVYRNECIFIDNNVNRYNWFTAKEKCESLNASMLTLHDAEKAKYVTDRSTARIWLGLIQKSQSYQFEWFNGEEYDYSRWRSGLPSLSRKDCAMFYGAKRFFRYNSFRWSAHQCGAILRFICESEGSQNTCEDTWLLHQDKCIKIVNIRQSWHNAKLHCKSENATLIEIRNEEINSFLEENTAKGYYYWTGLNDVNNTGKWFWNEATEEATWTKWALGEPNDKSKYWPDCVYRRRSSYYDIKVCGAHYSYICEKLASDDDNCEDLWKYYNGSCYRFFEEYLTWPQAIDACQQANAYLVKIDTADESIFLDQVTKNYSWIGLKDVDGSKNFRWAIDDSTPQFDIPRSVAKRKRKGCATMQLSKSYYGKWLSVGCVDIYGFVCEAPYNEDATYSDWVKKGSSMYLINVNITKTWLAAQLYCKNIYNASDLVVFNDEAEHQFIKDEIEKIDSEKIMTSAVWLGLYREYLRGSHKSVIEDDMVLDYSDWVNGKPASRVIADCVGIFYQYWEDVSCFYCGRTVACQKPADGDSSFYDFRLENKVYKVVTGQVKHSSAKKHCQEQFGTSASLMTIDSKEKFSMIKTELKNRFTINSNMKPWISLSNSTFNVSETKSVSALKMDKINEVAIQLGMGPHRNTVTSNQRILSIGKRIDILKNPEELDYCPILKANLLNWRTKEWEIVISKDSCCNKHFFICEKNIGSDSADYDFYFDNILYKIFTTPTDAKSAAEKCSISLGGGGLLLNLTSLEDIDEIGAEIITRHYSSSSGYWVAADNGSDTCNTYEFEVDAFKVKSGVVLFDVPCDSQKNFICERRIYLDDKLYGHFVVEGNENMEEELLVVAVDQTVYWYRAFMATVVCLPLIFIILLVLIFSRINSLHSIIHQWENPFLFKFKKADDRVILEEENVDY